MNLLTNLCARAQRALVIAATVAMSIVARHASAQETATNAAATPFPQDSELHLTKAWDRDLTDTLVQARAFTVINLNLYAAVNTAAGPSLSAIAMKADSANGNPVAIDLSPIPAAFHVTAIGSNPFQSLFFLAGNLDDSPMIFRAKIGAKGIPAGWEALPAFPEKSAPTFSQVYDMDEYTLFLTASDESNAATVEGGWAANAMAQGDQFQWKKIPEPTRSPKGASAVTLGNRVFHAGGDTSPTDGPLVAEMEAVTFDKANFGAWQPVYLPVPRTVKESVGISKGSAMYVAPRNPLLRENANQFPQVYCSTMIDGTNMSPWNPIFLSEKPATLRALQIDPGHNRLLLIAETKETTKLIVTAYELPSVYSSRRKTDEELMLDRLDETAAKPPRIGPAELLEKIREKKIDFGLIIVSDGERKEDLKTRSAMNSNQFAYMTRDTEMTYLTAAEGSAILRKYGIEGTPAYLLIDKDGNLVQKFSGKIATPEDIFKLTSPIRAPKPEPIPTQTPPG